MAKDITMTTSRASLCALGEYLKRHCFFAPLREHVQIRQKTVRYRPIDKLLDALSGMLCGAKTIAQNPKAKLAYIADAVPKAAVDLAALHGAKVASVDDIMRSNDVDAVLIGSPTGFHAEQIQKAAPQTLAVFRPIIWR